MSDSTNTIKKSAKRFFSGTLLSRISGMLRDMSMAYVFGAEASVASFLLAFRLAHLMRRLFGEGAIQSAFVPEFEALRLTNEKKAHGFFCSLTLCISLIVLTSILFFGMVLGAILQWGNVSSANHEVIYLTILMLPSLLFICLYGLNASLLQCQHYFFVSSVAPVAFNVIWIITVMGLKNLSSQEAMPYLAIGVIFACFFQWIWTVPTTFRFIKKSGVSSIIKESSAHFQNLLQLIKPLTLGILGVAASQINNLVDSLFGRYAELEGPAILWYSIRLQQLPLALFGIAISGAILPPLARAVKSGNYERYYYFLSYGLLATLGFMLPITGMIFCMGDTGVNLIYGRGDFNDSAIHQTTMCLWAYGIGLVPSALILILAPAYYAKSNYKLPALISFLTMIVNLFLNSIFIFVFKWGIFSVAMATSLSAWVNLAILYSKINEQILNKKSLFFIFKIILATFIATFSVILVRNLMGNTWFIHNSSLNWPKNASSQFFNLIYQLITFILVWVTNIFFLRLSFNEIFLLKFSLNDRNKLINN